MATQVPTWLIPEELRKEIRMLGVIFLWYPDPGGTMTPGAPTRANPGLGV